MFGRSAPRWSLSLRGQTLPAFADGSARTLNFAQIAPLFTAKLSQTCYISHMKWEIKYHDEKLQADVLALPPGILARYFHCTDRMLMFGPASGMPHTRAMSMGLF